MNRVLLILVVLLSVACSRQAYIVDSTGATLEARIVGHDAEARTLDVENEAGERRTIALETVQDIDHPGNVMATTGGILTGLGLGMLGLGVWAIANEDPDQPDSPGSPFALGGVFFALGGAPMLIWGLVAWTDSVGHVDDAGGLQLAPSVNLGPDHATVGISGRF